MPARSVTRPSIPGRIRNPYYAQAQTAPGGNAAAAQQANAQRLAQLREQQLAAANNGQSGLELHFSLNGAPEANVQTPYGEVGLLFSPQGPTINRNLTFNEPYSASSSGYSMTGTTAYHYTVQQAKGSYSLVPQQTSQHGSISYGNTVIATTKNNILSPTGNTVTNPIYSNGTFFGNMTYVPSVANNRVSLVPKSFAGTNIQQPVYGNVTGVGSHVFLGNLTEKTVYNPTNNAITEQYQSFAGTTLQRTVPVWFTDPYSGTSYKVGYTWQSKKTTYNPTTNQVNVPFPTLMQTFGYFSTPLFRQAQTTSVALGTSEVSVNYNMSVNPFSASAYYTGFGPTNAHTTTATGTSGTTHAYLIQNGNIVNTSATTPITIPGITTKALMYSDFASGTSTILNPSATAISGNVAITGSLSLSGTTINFNPIAYSFTNGANSMTISDASASVLGALGGPAASAQPGGILSEKINQATGVVSYSYSDLPSTLSPAALFPTQPQTGYKTTPSLLSNPTDSTVSTPPPHLIQFSSTSPSVSQSNTYSSSKNLSLAPTLSAAPSASPYAWAWNSKETPLANIHGFLSAKVVEPLTFGNYQGSLLAFWQPIATAFTGYGKWNIAETSSIVNAIPSTVNTPFQNNTAVNWARSFVVSATSSVLDVPAGVAQMVAAPVGSIYGTAGFVGQVVAHPSELLQPRVAGQVAGSVITFAILGKLGSVASATGDVSASIDINPTSTVTAYTSTPTGITAGVGVADEATALDRLNSLKAEPVSYLPGLGSSTATISTSEYQVGFGNGKFFYAINPAAPDFEAAYGSASDAISRNLYSPAPVGTPMLTGSRYIFSAEEGQGSIIQSIGKTQADIIVPSGVQKLGGVPVKNIMGMTIEYTSSTTAASTDVATETATGEASFTAKLLVKRNPISSFFSGESYKTIPVTTGTTQIPAGYVTGTDEGFVGRILPQENGYIVRSADSSSSFYGSNPQETVLGREYTGSSLYDGKATPAIYYETSDLSAAAKQLGIDVPAPEGAPTATPRPWKPMSATLTMPDASPDAVAVASASPPPSAPASADAIPSAITKQSTSFKTAVVGAPTITSLTVPVEMESEFTATYGAPALISGVGYDPMVVISTNSRQSTSIRQQSNISNMLSRSTGIATSLLYKQQSSISRQLVQSNVMGIAQSSFLKTSPIGKSIVSQQTTQKTSQKTSQKTITSAAYPAVGFPMGYPQPNVPFPLPLAPTRIPPRHHHIQKPTHAPTVFGYLPDVSSTILGIHGKKKNKKFYQSIGLSRPVL